MTFFLYLSISHRESSERSEIFHIIYFPVPFFIFLLITHIVGWKNSWKFASGEQVAKIRKTMREWMKWARNFMRFFILLYWYSSLHESRAENKTTTRKFHFQRLASLRFSIACEKFQLTFFSSESVRSEGHGGFGWNAQIVPLFLWISDSCSDKMMRWKSSHTGNSFNWIFVLNWDDQSRKFVINRILYERIESRKSVLKLFAEWAVNSHEALSEQFSVESGKFYELSARIIVMFFTHSTIASFKTFSTPPKN